MFAQQLAALLQSLQALIENIQHLIATQPETGTPELPGDTGTDIPTDPGTGDNGDEGIPDLPEEGLPPAVVVPLGMEGRILIRGTDGDDVLTGTADPDLFMVGSGADTIEGFEQGVDTIWFALPQSLDGQPVNGVISVKEYADGEVVFRSLADFVDNEDGSRDVRLVLDDTSIQVRGLDLISNEDWLFLA